MTTKQKTSSFKFTLFKWSAIILLIGFVSYPLAKVLRVIFGKVDPKLRARVFMAYRNKFADSHMIGGRYKPTKPNQYPEDIKRDEFNKIAQDKSNGVLTKYNYPEHFAREPEWNFTLCDDVYYLLWNIRVKVCEALTKLSPDEKGEKTDKKKEDKKFFKQIPTMKDEDYKNLFNGVDKDGKGWAAASGKFCDILLKLINTPEVYKFKGDEVSKELEKDICDFIGQLGYSKEKVEEFKKLIPDLFIRYGEAYPTVWYSTIYSRLYYYLIFLTINTKFDFSEIKDNDCKPEKYNEKTMKILASLFAQLFSRVYETDYNYENKESSMVDKILNYLGPTQDVSGVKEQKANIEILKKALEKNKAILA